MNDSYRTLYKAWKNGTLTPEQHEALENMGFFDSPDPVHDPVNMSDDSYEGKYNDGR